jgi:hypothetical protein
MQSSEEIRLAYSTKYNGIANYWKKYIGQGEGIKRTGAINEKQIQEIEFKSLLQENKKMQSEYGDILSKLEVLYMDLEEVALHSAILNEVIGGRNIELFKLASYGDRLHRIYLNHGDAGYDYAKTSALESLDNYFRDYRENIDLELFSSVIEHVAKSMRAEYLPSGIPVNSDDQTWEEWVKTVFSQTMLTNHEKFVEAIQKGGASFSNWLVADTAYQIYIAFQEVSKNRLSLYSNLLYDQINPLQSEYVTALMEAYPNRRFWPDGNSTMRLTYGQVEGLSPQDGLLYKTQTYLEGVMEKYIPGDYEFDVPSRLISLYQSKDYGNYGENGKMPVAFIASNHTTNGNSGSPAIDAHGNLLGLNFDRIWEGTMSDLYYDKSLCRNIMVDARYILFIIDKFGGASNLITEMTLVHPKS